MRLGNLETMFVLACAFLVGGGGAFAQTTRVSVDSSGVQAYSASGNPSMTPDGRFVAFESYASTFVAGDTNWASDIFVHDRLTGATERVSVDSNGVQGNGYSYTPSISADGRFVAFESSATNLVTGDTNGMEDIFVHDRVTGSTERVSVDSIGAQANDYCHRPSISADGRFVAFETVASGLVPGDTNASYDIFVHDRVSGTTERVSLGAAGLQANEDSFAPSISADGRFVAFHSLATNLVAGDTNGCIDVFVRDRVNGTTERVSVDAAGNQVIGSSYFPSISSDGRFVAFTSDASSLVAGDTNGMQDVFVHDRSSGVTERVSVGSTGAQGNDQNWAPSISSDGRFVVFCSVATNLVIPDTNNAYDVLIHDRTTGVTDRVSNGWSLTESDGNSDYARVSSDGRFVAFQSDATNLVPDDTNGNSDVFVRDRFSDANTVRASVAATRAEAIASSTMPAISADGEFIAFQSDASNLVPNDGNGLRDIFVHDRFSGGIERVSVDSAGNEANGISYHPSTSADGNLVAFISEASNLFANDTNGTADVLVRDRSSGTTECVSVDESGVASNDMCNSPAISADGQVVAFDSYGTNLVAGDTNAAADVFIHDRTTGLTACVSISSSGVLGNGGGYAPAIDSNGQIVAFTSRSTNLVAGDTNQSLDVFIHNRATRTTDRVSVDSSGRQGDGDSRMPAISADGRFVAFASLASNLVEGDTNGSWDVFLHDCVTGATTRVSVDTTGAEADGGSDRASISANGRFVTFASLGSNLVPGDANGVADVFTHDRATGLTERMSVDPAGADGNGGSGLGGAMISADARFVAFDSLASNFVADDLNGCVDVFVRDRRSAYANWWNYGAGFSGTHGVPALTPRSDPVLGTTVTLDLSNSYGHATVGLLFLGTEQARTHTGSGDLLLVPSTTQFIGLSPVGTRFTGQLPSDPSLIGFFIDLQAVEFDPGAARGVSFTQGLELVFGQ